MIINMKNLIFLFFFDHLTIHGAQVDNPTASHRHALLIMPRPLPGCHIKALDFSFNLAP